MKTPPRFTKTNIRKAIKRNQFGLAGQMLKWNYIRKYFKRKQK